MSPPQRMTHTGQKALIGATVIELAAWTVRERLTEPPPLDAFHNLITPLWFRGCDWQSLVETIAQTARDQGVGRRTGRAVGVIQRHDWLHLSYGSGGHLRLVSSGRRL